MKRFASIVLLLGLTASSQAQVAVTGEGNPKPRPEPQATTYELTVHAAKADDRPLRYALRPTPMDQKPGNAVTAYYLATSWLADQMQSDVMQDMRKELSDLLEGGIDATERERATTILKQFERTMEQFRFATRYERADWDYPIREQGVAMILPALGSYRDAARLFNARAQLRAAAGDTAGAIDDIQTQLAMADHVGNGPVLINDLIAVAIVGQTMQSLHALMQESQGPNLYWSLSQLPRPAVPLANSLAHEKQMLFFDAPQLYDATKRELTDAEWQDAIKKTGQTMRSILAMTSVGDQPANNAKADLGMAMRMAAGYPLAKQFLIEQRGMDPKQVEKMAPEQVVWSVVLDRFMHHSDELFKWFGLPYPEAAIGLAQAEQELAENQNTVLGGWPMSQLLPALGRAYFVSTQVDRHIAMLRIIEAVRLHTAEHGSLPKSLDQIKAAPIPNDPVTGTPFEYTTDGPTFELRGLGPEGHAARDAMVFKVTVVLP